jgi:Ca2+-binding RTX toxin-like protein
MGVAEGERRPIVRRHLLAIAATLALSVAVASPALGISGGGGDDVIIGTQGSNEIHGGYGDDVLLGHAGNDTIYGGPGSDLLRGGSGRDVCYVTSTDKAQSCEVVIQV